MTSIPPVDTTDTTQDRVVKTVTDNEQPNNEAKVPVDDPVAQNHVNSTDSYEGRKHDLNIDGPQQASQETDEIYADPRKEENLPAGGKNVADLNAYDLSQQSNDI